LDKNIETGRISHAVQSVNMHPDWNTLTESFDADIAVLVLEVEVVFGKFIQPVCMPNLESNIESAVTGIVVGYGKSEDDTKIHENIPKMLRSQIHNNVNCFQDNRALARISSGRTFCGGPGNGIGVCRGDSGGGLYVTDGRAYYLRGIVSSSLIDGRYGCDVDTFSVFTDVLKFADWIYSI
jgi:secreted trypsin-like serine protease